MRTLSVAALCAKSRRCPCSGGHRRAAQPPARKALPPNRQPTTRIHSPAAGPTRRARATPAVTEENIVNEHILRRCYCAETFDSLCSDARSTRRGRDASTTTEHTNRAHRTPVRSSDARLVSRNGAGVVGVASKHSESLRPRVSVRTRSQGPFLPSAFGVVWRGGRDASGARLQRGNQGGHDRASALASSEAHQSRLGTAEKRLRGAL